MASGQATWVRGADPVAASGVPDSAGGRSDRHHGRRWAGRAVPERRCRAKRPRCAGPDVGAVRRHREFAVATQHHGSGSVQKPGARLIVSLMFVQPHTGFRQCPAAKLMGSPYHRVPEQAQFKCNFMGLRPFPRRNPRIAKEQLDRKRHSLGSCQAGRCFCLGGFTSRISTRIMITVTP